jgi:hypothetical protein
MTDTAFNLTQILWDERAALRGEPLPSAEPPNSPTSRIAAINKEFMQLDANDLAGTYRQLNEDNRWALALSGGGIRSAAFALGIIQCFADHRVVSKANQNENEPLLQQFDYLSTVSGGGYVGSWFSDLSDIGGEDTGAPQIVSLTLLKNLASPVSDVSGSLLWGFWLGLPVSRGISGGYFIVSLIVNIGAGTHGETATVLVVLCGGSRIAQPSVRLARAGLLRQGEHSALCP